MKSNWFESGLWNALCDVCGFKRKSSELTERWDGMMVCRPSVKAGCWETRHPQELIRPIPDQLPLPWTRPEPPDRFISVTYNSAADQCSITGVYCQSDYMEADCAVVDETDGGLEELS